MENGSKPLRDALRHTRVESTLRGLAGRSGQCCTCLSEYLCVRCGGRLRARWERGAEALLWPDGLEWDAKEQYLTVGLRRGMRGQKAETGLRGGARCVTASGGFATEVSGQVGGAVVERRRVVSFAWIVSSWPSAWQRCAARLN
jgi:hypothetical protein